MGIGEVGKLGQERWPVVAFHLHSFMFVDFPFAMLGVMNAKQAIIAELKTFLAMEESFFFYLKFLKLANPFL